MGQGKRIRHALPPARWPSREEARAALLFAPLPLGRSQVLTARTWVPAMVPWRASAEGEVTQEVLDWYGRFAAGRPAALVVEATGIRDVPSGPLLRIGDDRFLPGLRALCREVARRSGGATRLFIQLIDFLAIRRRPPRDRYFERFLVLRRAHRERLAAYLRDDAWLTASEDELRRRMIALDEAGEDVVLDAREREELRLGARERVTDLDRPHIRELPRVLPELFARAAVRAEAAGFDGVELHYAHAYTMASFLSRTNDRDDGYGGSLEGRVRLPIEVLQAVRAAISPDTVAGCRILGDEVIAGGSTVEDARWYAAELARAGVDFISVSKGGKFEDARPPKVGHAIYPYTGESGHECMPVVWSDERGPFGRNLPLARELRLAVRGAGLSTPVVAAGGINSFELAEGALQRGDADLIAAARQSLADPDWFEKMRLGRGEEIRRCTFTSYCEGLDQQHKQVTCRLWDRGAEPFGEELVRLGSDGKRRLVAPPWAR